jgi:L-lactate permease
MDAAEVGRRKRRCSRAVIAGCSLMASALLLSAYEVGPPLATTIGALVGLVLLVYGVHVGWLIFYDRDDDGSPT